MEKNIDDKLKRPGTGPSLFVLFLAGLAASVITILFGGGYEAISFKKIIAVKVFLILFYVLVMPRFFRKRR
ncbi:hypothetical protein GWK08_01010 [Leptobacterium flavescens]|uniref:Uncharacterized protein n=1 Tax=Leptobacterium flavescens TaxID=472055 RepID=A0A6P0UG64_9FLAO|nr:hypothetical protein [Leptobacterium flavescens]NER12007.1 hypothetical protein [Leptobacterium flavescens]